MREENEGRVEEEEEEEEEEEDLKWRQRSVSWIQK